jgi:hypothetical protein
MRPFKGGILKQSSVLQAKARLEKAKSALAKLEDGPIKDTAVFRSAWSDFLLATASIYFKLEQGAKGNGPSEGWYGRKKHERKADPLLSYLHRCEDSHRLLNSMILEAEALV